MKLERKEAISAVEKIQKEYVEKLKEYIYTFSNNFSDFEKLNFLNHEGSNILSKTEYSRDDYKYIKITEYIVFDLTKKKFTHRNRRDVIKSEDFRSLLYSDFDLEKTLKNLRIRNLASNFIIEQKHLANFFRLCYRCKIHFSYEDFNKFLTGKNILQETYDKIQRKIYREEIFKHCKNYLSINQHCTFKGFIKISHFEEKYIREIFLDSDYDKVLVKKTIEMLNV